MKTKNINGILFNFSEIFENDNLKLTDLQKNKRIESMKREIDTFIFLTKNNKDYLNFLKNEFNKAESFIDKYYLFYEIKKNS